MEKKVPQEKKERDSKRDLNENKIFTMFKIDRARRRWRLIAIFAFILLMLSAIMNIEIEEKESEQFPQKDFIAKINIKGIIIDDSFRLKVINKLKESENVKAVILEIDSPGGAMVPGIELMENLQNLGKEKPLVARMKSIAASAGFMISLPAEYVVANQASLTGSVGVLMPLIDATELADKIGIKSAEVTSGKFKDITSPLVTRSPEATKYLQNTVNDLQKIFMDKVVERRKISPEVQKTISDGRFLIGQKAFEYKLVDKLGGEQDILDYLHEKGIDKDLEVIEVSLVKKKKYKWQEVFADELSNSFVKHLKTMLQSISLTPQAI